MSILQKQKTVYYLLTDTQIYKTDEILKQLDEWIDAFRTGTLIRVPYVDQNSLDEFEAHLEETLLENQKLAQCEFDF